MARIRYFELRFVDGSGQTVDSTVRFVEDGREAADGEFTHVMVRLKTPELEIVDTLIAAGIANNRAEAIRWALTRIRERPAYEQLRSALGSTPATLNGSRASSNCRLTENKSVRSSGASVCCPA